MADQYEDPRLHVLDARCSALIDEAHAYADEYMQSDPEADIGQVREAFLVQKNSNLQVMAEWHDKRLDSIEQKLFKGIDYAIQKQKTFPKLSNKPAVKKELPKKAKSPRRSSKVIPLKPPT